MLAIEFGEKYESCIDALEWRKSLGPDATQADAWRLCERSDWMIWQLWKVGRYKDNPALGRAIIKIVSRSIHLDIKSLRGVKAPWATDYRRWARRWLSGEDRTRESAAEAEAVARTVWTASVPCAVWAAWQASASSAAFATSASASETVVAERLRQARDIRSEISEWDEKWEEEK